MKMCKGQGDGQDCMRLLADSDPDVCVWCDLHRYEIEDSPVPDPYNNIGRTCAISDQHAMELGCPTGRSLRVVEYIASIPEHEYMVEWDADGSTFRTPVTLREMSCLF